MVRSSERATRPEQIDWPSTPNTNFGDRARVVAGGLVALADAPSGERHHFLTIRTTHQSIDADDCVLLRRVLRQVREHDAVRHRFHDVAVCRDDDRRVVPAHVFAIRPVETERLSKADQARGPAVGAHQDEVARLKVGRIRCLADMEALLRGRGADLRRTFFLEGAHRITSLEECSALRDPYRVNE